MKYSVLDIIQKASAEMGLTQPNTAVSSTDTTAIQMVGLLNALGDELMTYNWSVLHTEYTFQTEVGKASYDLPVDFLRIINQTEWNRSSSTPLVGPQTPAAWQQLQSGITSSIEYGFRIKGNKILVTPTPQAVETLALEYVSSNYVIDGTSGNGKSFVTMDSDRFIFNDRLMINGLKMKFKEAQGLETQFAEYDYRNVLDAERSADGGASVVCLTRQPSTYENIPDGNWNQ